jgi:hypothetical protein
MPRPIPFCEPGKRSALLGSELQLLLRTFQFIKLFQVELATEVDLLKATGVQDHLREQSTQPRSQVTVTNSAAYASYKIKATM